MYNNNFIPLDRNASEKHKKDNFFSCIKCKAQNAYSSLNEVEQFLSKISFSHKIIKLYSILK